jgi:hypothetical protein
METKRLSNARAKECHESLLSDGRVQPSITLSNGVEMPLLGYGVFIVSLRNVSVV